METKQLKTEKEALERRIHHAVAVELAAFQEATGLIISDVEINMQKIYSNGQRDLVDVIMSVKTQVEL